MYLQTLRLPSKGTLQPRRPRRHLDEAGARTVDFRWEAFYPPTMAYRPSRSLPSSHAMLIFSALAACGGEFDGPGEVETTSSEVIVGSNDLQHVEIYTPKPGSPFGTFFVEYYEPAVGELACTGTMISRDLMMTAGHCIRNNTLGSVILMNYQNRYDASGNVLPPASESFTVSEVVECGWAANASCAGFLPPGHGTDYDYAILRLAPNSAGLFAGDKYGWRHFDPSPPGPMAAASLPVAVIGHPQRQPKQVDTATLDGWDGYYLSHFVDTLPGNSGSGVLNIDGKIISLNTSESSFNNYGPAANDIFRVSGALDFPLWGNRYQVRNIASGGCLDVPSYWQSPTYLFGGGCKGAVGFLSNQVFLFEPTGSYYVVRVEHSQLCLELPGGTLVSGTEIRQASCNGSTNQQWRLIRSWTGAVMMCPRASSSWCTELDASTQRLVIRPYDAWRAANQTWRFDIVQKTSFIVDHSGRCIDIPGFSKASGVLPQSYPCKGPGSGNAFNQEWELRVAVGGQMEIVNTFSQKCLGVPDGNTTSGYSITQRTCTGSSYQRWEHLPQGGGKLKFRNAGSNRCMDFYSGRLQQYTCGGYPEQLFELRRGVD